MAQLSPFVVEERFEAPGGPRPPSGAPRAQAGPPRRGVRPEWPRLDPAGRAPCAPVAAPVPPDAPEPPTFTRAELEAAVALARAEAAQETESVVLADVRAGLEQRQTEALGAIARRLAEADACYREAVQLRATDTRELAVAMAQALAPRALALTPLADVETMLRDVIARLHAQPQLRLGLPPDLVDSGRSLLARVAAEAGFEGGLEVAADATLDPGEARLQWRHGLAERNLARLQAEARAVVEAWLPDRADAPGEAEGRASADPAAPTPAGIRRKEGAGA